MPNSKLFVPPVLMIREYFLRENVVPIIACDNVLASVFREFGIDTRSQDFLKTVSRPDVELVHLQVNHPGARDSFYRIVSDLKRNCETVRVRLWPDGLGNASWGERLDLQYSAEYGNEGIEFVGFFSFGFVHSTTQQLADDFRITTLDYDLLQKAISRSDSIKKIIAPAAEALTQRSSIIIPFRPWCTQRFHGGVYDFGDASDLSKIYSDLIHIANTDGFAGCRIYFRPDERFQAESKTVMDSLRNDFNVMDLSNVYPQWLTLEPLLSVICSRNDSKPFAMISLDSTSFQSVPFLANGRVSAAGYVGARSSSLESVPGGIEFVKRRLTGKVRDFERRYRHFQSLQRVRSVEQVETNLLKVVV
jgi:hypothetical protein